MELLSFLAFLAGFAAGFIVFFKEDREADIWEKRRKLGYHLSSYRSY